MKIQKKKHMFVHIFIYIFAICNFQSHWARLLWTNNDEGNNLLCLQCYWHLWSTMWYWFDFSFVLLFYIHDIVIHLLVTSVVPIILIVIVANLLFSRFQVHGIVPARLSMFPILLMSSKVSLNVNTKEGRRKTNCT